MGALDPWATEQFKMALDAEIEKARRIDRVERYLRVTVEIPGGVVEAGLQRLGIGEPVSILRSEYARLITEECLALNGNDIDDDSAQRITDSLEIRLLQTWPQRLWFVEFWDLHEALTQTYHPSWMRRR